jgi:hypothetical protein
MAPTFIAEAFDGFPCLLEINVEGCMDEIEINVIELKLLETCFKSLFRIVGALDYFCGNEQLVSRNADLLQSFTQFLFGAINWINQYKNNESKPSAASR